MPLSFTGLSLFEAYVEKVMRAYDACGMAVAIVDQGQPVQELFYGFRDREQKLPINQDTIFGLASVTKYLHLSGNPPSGPAGKNRPGRTGQPIYSIFS